MARTPPAIAALAQLLESTATAIHLSGFKDGLQPVHWVALRYFARCNLSAATVIQFADHHGTTRGTASKTITLLVDKGLLNRKPDSKDRRRHFLTLTDAGAALLDADPLAPVVEALSAVPDQDRVPFARCLERVIRALRQER